MYKGEESLFECNKIRFILKADNTSSTNKYLENDIEHTVLDPTNCTVNNKSLLFVEYYSLLIAQNFGSNAV
jgi:hypothetical protein